MGLASELEIGLLPERTAFDPGLAVDHPDAETVVLAGGNWPIPLWDCRPLETAIDKPVLTPNQLSLWAALRLAEYHSPGFGWGRLLRNHMVYFVLVADNGKVGGEARRSLRRGIGAVRAAAMKTKDGLAGCGLRVVAT
jgi:hypothetical protein